MKKASLIVADSERSADIFYATGFRAPDPFIYFSSGSLKAVILSALEYDRGVQECHSDIKLLRYEDFIVKGRRSIGDVLMVLVKSLNIGAFRVPPDFPVVLADFLRKHGVKIAVARNGFFPQREFKNENELHHMREAQRVTGLAMRRAEGILHTSKPDAEGILHWNNAVLTSEIVRTEINIELLRNGSVAASTIVAGGRQSAEPHNEGSGPLRSNTPVVIDIFPRMTETGYFGDMTRTFVKGKAPETVCKAYAAVRSAREHSKKMIRTGSVPAEIHNAADAVLKTAGFASGRRDDGRSFGFFHGLGHGLGLEVHEAPRLNQRNLMPLRGGEVVTVEPGLYYPEWGGVRLEDVVAVGEAGCECLTHYHDQLEI
ncbi:MAG: Xaa-Pro peptidase family protein [Victivallaceae bacterium]|nr:Xaa-Pro peptidase family protein [Victivallaceae bacterium]